MGLKVILVQDLCSRDLRHFVTCRSSSLVFASMTDLHGFLNPNDAVAISFWIISISMVAATVFFLMESTNVGLHWKTSLNCGALVTLVAARHQPGHVLPPALRHRVHAG